MTSPQLATNTSTQNVATVTISNFASLRAQALRRLLQKAELFAAKGVSYHQTYAHWRIRRLASQWQRQPSLPTSVELAFKLTQELPALEAVRKAATQADQKLVQSTLRAYFGRRDQPNFFFMPTEREEIVSLVSQMDNEGKNRTIHIADQICHNSFCFRNTAPVRFAEGAGGIDWQHCPNGNIDWRWDLNRHAYFESLGRAYRYTGDERYVAKFSALLLDWLAKNPASVSHPSWSSVFEVAFRINTWLWAFHLFQHAPSLDGETFVALLAGLWTHGHFLNTHLELHAQNNHLLLEAKSLAMLGILFPEFQGAAHWRTRGLTIFCEELREQTCDDGVHGERASLYHCIISGELLELLVLADNNDLALPPEISDILAKMVEFELWITKPNGQISLVGDSALEDVHLRFSGISGGAAFTGRHDLKAIAPPLGESEIWLLGRQRMREELMVGNTTEASRPNSPQMGGRLPINSRHPWAHAHFRKGAISRCAVEAGLRVPMHSLTADHLVMRATEPMVMPTPSALNCMPTGKHGWLTLASIARIWAGTGGATSAAHSHITQWLWINRISRCYSTGAGSIILPMHQYSNGFLTRPLTLLLVRTMAINGLPPPSHTTVSFSLSSRTTGS